MVNNGEFGKIDCHSAKLKNAKTSRTVNNAVNRVTPPAAPKFVTASRCRYALLCQKTRDCFHWCWRVSVLPYIHIKDAPHNLRLLFVNFETRILFDSHFAKTIGNEARAYPLARFGFGNLAAPRALFDFLALKFRNHALDIFRQAAFRRVL